VDVELNALGASLEREPEPRQRVLDAVAGHASMGNQLDLGGELCHTGV